MFPDGITSGAVLAKRLSEIAESVILSASKDILNLLQKRIMEDTYLYDTNPRTWYYDKTGKPTYEFLNSFRWKDVSNTVVEVTRELFYNWESMSYNAAKFKHGSFLSGDMRKQLADILNVNGIDTPNDWGGRERLAYWDNFLDDLFNSTRLVNMFKKYLSKYGQVIIS